MISSKKPSRRRVKSTSPIRNKNKSTIYNNKKKDNILAIEESKKLYLKLFANPSTIVTNQLKGEELKIYLKFFLRIISSFLLMTKFYLLIEFSHFLYFFFLFHFDKKIFPFFLYLHHNSSFWKGLMRLFL